MNQELRVRMDGIGILFRFVTPALLGVLIWIVQDMHQALRLLSNDYYHQLSEINGRLGRLEGRLMTK